MDNGFLDGCRPCMDNSANFAINFCTAYHSPFWTSAAAKCNFVSAFLLLASRSEFFCKQLFRHTVELREKKVLTLLNTFFSLSTFAVSRIYRRHSVVMREFTKWYSSNFSPSRHLLARKKKFFPYSNFKHAQHSGKSRKVVVFLHHVRKTKKGETLKNRQIRLHFLKLRYIAAFAD